MATEVKVGDSLLRITDGIYTTLRCTKCGKNLPIMTWDCPNCTGTLTAENVQVNLKTLQVARYGRWLPRDMARARIVEAVIESLNIEDRARLAEYEIRENPSEEER